MIIWLLIVLGWLLTAPTWAATLVQTATGANSCGTSTATFGVAVTNGNSIIVTLTDDSSTIATPSDGTNTYTQIAASNTNETAAIFRATNVTGSITSVSVTGGCSAVVAYEVSGLAAGNDGTNSGAANSATAATGNVTTTGSGILFSVVSVGATGSITPGGGWTEGYEVESFSTMTINSGSQLSGGSGTFSQSWTLGAAASWNAAVAAFKDAATAVTGCRLVQNGTDKRLLQNGTDGRLLQGGNTGACIVGGPTVIPVQMMLGVGP